MNIGPRRVDKPLVLYGYGRLGHLAQEVFVKQGIPISEWFDGTHPPAVQVPGGLLAIATTSEPYHKIIAPLKAHYDDIVSVYDIFEAYPECGVTGGWFTGSSIPDRKEILSVMNRLDDFPSKEQYMLFRLWHQWRADQVPFGPPLDLVNRWMIPEVKAVLHGEERIYPEIPGSTLVDIRNRHRLEKFNELAPRYDYIQLHCEGKELESIEASLGYFKQHRPIIAVTVYHSRDGLWKIEKALMDNLTDYRFHFRMHAYQGQAAILYCLPNERSSNGTVKV